METKPLPTCRAWDCRWPGICWRRWPVSCRCKRSLPRVYRGAGSVGRWAGTRWAACKAVTGRRCSRCPAGRRRWAQSPWGPGGPGACWSCCACPSSWGRGGRWSCLRGKKRWWDEVFRFKQAMNFYDELRVFISIVYHPSALDQNDVDAFFTILLQGHTGDGSYSLCYPYMPTNPAHIIRDTKRTGNCFLLLRNTNGKCFLQGRRKYLYL